MDCNVNLTRYKIGLEKKTKKVGFIINDDELMLIKLQNAEKMSRLKYTEQFLDNSVLLKSKIRSAIPTIASTMLNRTYGKKSSAGREKKQENLIPELQETYLGKID